MPVLAATQRTIEIQVDQEAVGYVMESPSKQAQQEFRHKQGKLAAEKERAIRRIRGNEKLEEGEKDARIEQAEETFRREVERSTEDFFDRHFRSTVNLFTDEAFTIPVTRENGYEHIPFGHKDRVAARLITHGALGYAERAEAREE